MGEIDELLEKTFRGETSEVGLYLAMARQAEREGHYERGCLPQATRDGRGGTCCKSS